MPSPSPPSERVLPAHRGCAPPARVVALDEVGEGLEPGAFDLAVNIHSFPECTYAAVEWWMVRSSVCAFPTC